MALSACVLKEGDPEGVPGMPAPNTCGPGQECKWKPIYHMIKYDILSCNICNMYSSLNIHGHWQGISSQTACGTNSGERPESVDAQVTFIKRHSECECDCEVTQSCPTLYDPMDCSPPGSSVHGIF